CRRPQNERERCGSRPRNERKRCRSCRKVFRSAAGGEEPRVFEHGGTRTDSKQREHTLEATEAVSHELKNSLVGLARSLFGEEAELRWVDTYFPFTHPSWELEVRWGGEWLELLGCGVVEHRILQTAGAVGHIGWAFGVGLERLAMLLYGIPDIRLFWSKDSGFLSQFQGKKPEDRITYTPVSIYPQCANDISFWLPQDQTFSPNDFYDLARSIGGDIIEQVSLIDVFTHPGTRRTSHCYRVVYRHMERTLAQEEVNAVHARIERAAASRLNVTVR
ncbi:probable phenylalanine--tRNA ligase, mitochondrial, partial [Bacillus rossius redtenbacheri]|uniref:probable phenylalanine--tRNA ligase, mitochondrial n=1 Tax=Bacillus rossius redtenbacheri TaxID=93214 RepID=UPI002FDD5261